MFYNLVITYLVILLLSNNLVICSKKILFTKTILANINLGPIEFRNIL